MQPFQCDVAPQRQKMHRTTHTGTSIVTKHIEGTKRPQPQPPHKRGSFHRRLQPPYKEKYTVSCSGFLPITHGDLPPQCQKTHRFTHTGTCIVAKHIACTQYSQPQPPHKRGSFHRRLQSLYTIKTQGFVLRLPPQNIAHAIFMQPF